MNTQPETIQQTQARLKEVARLAKEPFKTMAKVIEQETIDQLKGWKEPSHAYILFEMPCMHALQGGDFKRGFTLTTMNVEWRPEQVERFYFLVRKGARPLHYGNFPSHNDANAERAKRARMHTGPSGVSPWDELARVVKSQLYKDEGGVTLKEKAVGLEAKLAEARAELAALKKKETK